MTHEIVSTGAAAWWQMVRLPRAGAVADQDARLMDALAVLRGVENVMLSENTGEAGADV